MTGHDYVDAQEKHKEERKASALFFVGLLRLKLMIDCSFKCCINAK